LLKSRDFEKIMNLVKTYLKYGAIIGAVKYGINIDRKTLLPQEGKTTEIVATAILWPILTPIALIVLPYQLITGNKVHFEYKIQTKQ
jgi:hypothetical protein